VSLKAQMLTRRLFDPSSKEGIADSLRWRDSLQVPLTTFGGLCKCLNSSRGL
jgi:hypothetical protein